MSETKSEVGRIVVGVDGSNASKEALRWALHQAELTGASVEVVSAWHFPTAAYGAVPVPVDFDFSEMATMALHETIADVVGDESAVPVTKTVVEGPAALKLLEAAVGAELLVVGSRGHGAFTGMLLGSVSEHCVSHSPCPIVVLHHAAGAA